MAGGTVLVVMALVRRLVSSGDGGQQSASDQPSSRESGESSLLDSRLMALLVGTVVLAVVRRFLKR